MTQEQCYVGIDVSKTTLDIAVRPQNKTWTTTNDEAGISSLVADLKARQLILIVLESTGGLELPVVAALAAAQFPVVVVNPRQVRDFAKATGQLAKTDQIDADILAWFGEAVRPEVRPLKDDQAQELAALITRRRQLIDMLTAEKIVSTRRLNGFVKTSKPIFNGWKNGSLKSIMILIMPSKKVPSGEKKMRSYKVHLASDPYYRSPCSPTCPNLAD